MRVLSTVTLPAALPRSTANAATGNESSANANVSARIGHPLGDCGQCSIPRYALRLERSHQCSPGDVRGAQTTEPASAKALAAHTRSTDRACGRSVQVCRRRPVVPQGRRRNSVNKVRLTSKPERTSNPTGQGAGNPMIIPAYVFAPKNLHGKTPLIVFVHGGVHGNVVTSYAHIVRELID